MKKRDMTKATTVDLLKDLEEISRLLAPDQRDDYTAAHMIAIVIVGVTTFMHEIEQAEEYSSVPTADKIKALQMLKPWSRFARTAMLAGAKGTPTTESQAVFAARAGSRKDN